MFIVWYNMKQIFQQFFFITSLKKSCSSCPEDEQKFRRYFSNMLCCNYSEYSCLYFDSGAVTTYSGEQWNSVAVLRQYPFKYSNTSTIETARIRTILYSNILLF